MLGVETFGRGNVDRGDLMEDVSLAEGLNVLLSALRSTSCCCLRSSWNRSAQSKTDSLESKLLRASLLLVTRQPLRHFCPMPISRPSQTTLRKPDATSAMPDRAP